MKRKVNLELSPNQLDFVRSTKLFTLFCGGLGSGKTYGGAVWSVLMALEYPECRGLITANSYSQLKKATLPKVYEILDLLGIRYEYKEQKGELHLGTTVIYCISMEKYDLLRGIEVGWAWSDECAFYKEEAFNVLIGRIRDRKGSCQWKGTTTPNGYNWLYSTFVENPLKSSKIIRSSTLENVENLSDAYYDTLRAQYDSRLARQELDGEFVNLSSGKVYYAFDRQIHLKEVTHDHAIVYVGLDFNVHPLCGIFCVMRDGIIQVVDELYLENSNTFEASKEIVDRYYSNVMTKRLKVIPDESGRKRGTHMRPGETDHEILRRAIGRESVIKFRNPEVKDRYNNMNRLFDLNLIVISPKCKKLIEDLEKMIYDNKDPLLSHISDALGYACWHLNPLKKPRRQAKVHYI